MLEEELPGGQQIGAGFFHVARKAAPREKVVEAVDGSSFVVLAVIHLGPVLCGFDAEHVVVTVALAKGAIVEEVVADPDIDHGGLRRDGFDGRMRIDARHYGQKAVVAGADDAHAAIVAGHVFHKPGDGVVGVGAFVGGLGIAMATPRTWTCPWGPQVTGERAHHDEFPVAFGTAANIFRDEDVAVARQFGAAHKERLAAFAHDAVRRAREEDGQWRGNVGRFEKHRVQPDAVAHGNHGFAGDVIVEDVMHRRAAAQEIGAGHEGESDACGLARCVEGERDSVVVMAKAEGGCREPLEFGGNPAVRFHGQLAVAHVEAEGVAGFALGGVFAGKGVERHGGRRLRGERGREGKQSNEESGNRQAAGDQSSFLRN